jgi:hypothetical protein
VHKSPLYTEHPSHTAHSSWNRFTHVKRGNTHSLNVESRRQPYRPNPHTNQHIKVSTLYTTHSSNFSKPIVSCHDRLSFKSGFGVVSVCGHVSRHTDTVFFLYLLMCPHTQTQNRPPLNPKRLQSNKRALYSKSAV